MSTPDPEQAGLRDAALDTLRAHSATRPALLAAAGRIARAVALAG